MSLFNSTRFLCNCELKREYSKEDLKQNKIKKCDRRDCQRLQHIVCSNEKTRGSLRIDQWLCDHCWEEAAERDSIKKAKVEEKQKLQDAKDAARRKRNRELAAERKRKRKAEAASEREEDDRDTEEKIERVPAQEKARALIEQKRLEEARQRQDRLEHKRLGEERREEERREEERRGEERQQQARTAPKSPAKTASEASERESEDPPAEIPLSSPPPVPSTAAPIRSRPSIPSAPKAPPAYTAPLRRQTGEEVRAALIKDSCQQFYWPRYCALGGSDSATDLCNELTRREAGQPVYEPPEEWVELLQSQFVRMFEVARYDEKIAILWKFKDPKGDENGRNDLVAAEAVWVINHSTYKFKKAELGLLLEVVGIAFKGEYWRP